MRRRASGGATERLRHLVETRAGFRCEYYRAPQWACGYRFHLEHISPNLDREGDAPNNLALACASCNLAKGSIVAFTERSTKKPVGLFNPRSDDWDDHFQWSVDFSNIIETTDFGRVTVDALDMNGPVRVSARQYWHHAGLIP